MITHKRDEITKDKVYPLVDCNRLAGRVEDWSYYWKDVTCKNCLRIRGKEHYQAFVRKSLLKQGKKIKKREE